MGLYKQGDIWWLSLSHRGKRIRRSAGTKDKQKAQQLYDKLRAELWAQDNLGAKPNMLWSHAVLRWLKEKAHKKSIDNDRLLFKSIDEYLGDKELKEINKTIIQILIREELEKKISNASINRRLALIRAVLNMAVNEWEWLDKAPFIKLLPENNGRTRWLTPGQAKKLINELPTHLADLVAFSLLTGLRQSNVLTLKWEQVDLENKHAFINAKDAKSGKAIPVPLVDQAIEIIKAQIGKHKTYIFTYKGNPIKECNTKAWKNALNRAGIEDFRWHDLRHTWASWHVQAGTSLYELQVLAGWSCQKMAMRYAHLNSESLLDVAKKIDVINLSCVDKGGKQ